MKSGSVATVDAISSTKLPSKTDGAGEREWIPRAWICAIIWSKTRRVGVVAAGMEGKRLAMTVLTVLPAHQLYCDKTGRGTVEAQTGSAEYLVASAIMSKARRDNTLLKHSAHSLV